MKTGFRCSGLYFDASAVNAEDRQKNRFPLTGKREPDGFILITLLIQLDYVWTYLTSMTLR
jgi:hypothetical protein